MDSHHEDDAERIARLEPTIAHKRSRHSTDQRIRAVEKSIEALKLRKRGKSYDEIAKEVGYAERGAAWRAVDRALRQELNEPAESLRVLEIERLNTLLDANWECATTPGAKGQAQAVDKVLAIMKRRAELLGLDAPKKHETVTKSTVESEIERLEKQLGPEQVASLRAKVREERRDDGG